MDDLKKVLSSPKNNKARDAHGHNFEIFKYGGPSLKTSLLSLFNRIKKEQMYPSILQPSNVTSIWKGKGERNNLDNDRGIFNVTKLRSILDKLIMNDIYGHVLIVERGFDSLSEIELTNKTVTLGRGRTADVVIDNDGSIGALKAQVGLLFNNRISLAGENNN